MLAHGAEVILYHNWLTPVFGGETGGFGLVESDGRPTERLKVVKELSSEVQKVWPHIKDAGLKPEYAIAYLYDSDTQAYQELGPPRPVSGQWEAVRGDLGIGYNLVSLEGIYRFLWNEFEPVDFIFKRHLDKSPRELGQYRLIILPNPYLLAEQWIDTLINYVREGGYLIIESRFGKKDDMGHLVVPPPVKKELGLEYIHTITIDTGHEPAIKGVGKACGFMDLVRVGKRGKVLLECDNGFPAFIESKMGRGRILYCTFSLGLSAMNPENQGLLRYIKSYIRNHISSQQAYETDSPELEVIFRGDSLFYLLNHGTGRATVNLIQKGASGAEEILSGKRMAVNRERVTVHVPPGGVRVVVMS